MDGTDSPGVTRRSAVKALAAGGLGFAWGASVLSSLPAYAASAAAKSGWRFPAGGYGPLIEDPAKIIDLPAGFRYLELVSARSTLADGTAAPGRPDAMASFAVGRNTVIAVNHELSRDDGAAVPQRDGANDVATYDRALHGGVSLITLSPTAAVMSHRPALSGTARNCAGGPTPWGTWLTCEESEATVDGTPHGYVFEVDPRNQRSSPTPYKAMGRFPHEAAAVDPKTSEVYLTEDNGGDALLYKFVPTDRSKRFGSLGRGGQLFAMGVPGVANLGEITTVGRPIAGVTWTPTPNPDNRPTPQDITNLKAVYADDSVTRGQKLEGAWFFGGMLTFVSSFNDSVSNPTYRHDGQVFVLDPVKKTLTLVAYVPVGGLPAPNGESVSRPDNISVSRFGGVVWCEDGDDPNCIGALDAAGTPICLARSRKSGELTGVHFSPDGRWLFVNQQVEGRTLAISGPWKR